MTCDLARDLLQPLIDGELEREEARALERHLADCAGCRDERDLAASLTGTLELTLRPERFRASERPRPSSGSSLRQGEPDVLANRTKTPTSPITEPARPGEPTARRGPWPGLAAAAAVLVLAALPWALAPQRAAVVPDEGGGAGEGPAIAKGPVIVRLVADGGGAVHFEVDWAPFTPLARSADAVLVGTVVDDLGRGRPYSVRIDGVAIGDASLLDATVRIEDDADAIVCGVAELPRGVRSGARVLLLVARSTAGRHGNTIRLAGAGDGFIAPTDAADETRWLERIRLARRDELTSLLGELPDLARPEDHEYASLAFEAIVSRIAVLADERVPDVLAELATQARGAPVWAADTLEFAKELLRSAAAQRASITTLADRAATPADRRAVLTALGEEVDVPVDEWLGALLAVVGSREETDAMRIEACSLLVVIEDPAPALPVLRDVLADRTAPVALRVAAVPILADMWSPEADEVLYGALDDGDEELIEEIVRELLARDWGELSAEDRETAVRALERAELGLAPGSRVGEMILKLIASIEQAENDEHKRDQR